MSRNVEKRVAELEFRNQQFETAAKESIGTLQRLEESLAFKTAEKGVSGLESIIKTLNKFNPITNMLNHLTSAFDTARQRISVGFFDQIGYDLENLSKKFIDFLGPEYIKTGFDKYEKEIASVQTLVNTTGKGTKEVMKYTEKLRWFTDETSYYYDDMISNLGRFTSAGVKIDDAMTSLIGIADAAGYFGVSASNASHAMTGFANAIASGVMTTQNWKWIETAHLDVEGFKDALIEAGVAMGTLQKSSSGVTTTLKGTEVTAANFRTTLRDGWLTTEAMNKAFAKFGKATDDIYDKLNELVELDENVTTRDVVEDYASEFDEVGLAAFKASQETKTFTDAIEYVRTAVASNWSKTWQIIIGDYDDAREVWGSVVDDLYDLFVASGEARNNMLERWREENGRSELLASIRNFYEGIKAAVRPIQQVWRELFPKKTGKELAAITTKLREFSEKFRAVFEGIADIFEPAKEAVEDFCDDISKRVQVVAEPIERTTELLDQLANAVIQGEYGNGQARRDALQGLVYSYEEIQNRVNELLGSSFRYEVTQQEIVEGAKEVAEAVEEENEELEEQGFQIENADSRIGRVQRTFAGIYAAGLTFMKVMKEVGSGIASVFGTIKDEILMPLVDWVLSFTSVWGDSMVEMYAKGEVFESIKKTIQDTVSTANKWITKFANNFRTKIYPSIGPFFSAVIDFAKKNIPNLWKIVKSGLKIAIGLVTNLWKIIKPFIPTLETIAGFIVDKITWGMEKLAEYTPTITEKLGGAFEWVSEKVVTLVTNVQELWNQFSISDAWSRLKTSMQGVGELFSDLGQIIHDTFFKIFGANADYDEFAENGPGQAITRSLEPAPEAEDNKNKMLGFVETIANGISDFAEKITAKKEEIKNFFALFTESLANNIRIMGNAVTNVVNGVAKFGEDSWKGLTDFVTYLDSLTAINFSDVSKSISNFFTTLSDTVKNVDETKLQNVFDAFIKGGGMVALLKFADGFGNITKNLGTIPTTFNNLLLTAQGTLLSYQKKINATNLKKIAEAIGILALSVIGLAMLDSDQLNNATAAITSLGIIAALLLKVAGPWLEAKAKLAEVKATAEQAKETQKMIADNGPAVLLSIFVQPLKDLATGLSSAAKTWASKHKTSVFLISVGITLMMIMHVLEQIKEMQQDVENLRNALYNLAFIASGLVVFAYLMALASRTFEQITEVENGTTKWKQSSFGLRFSIAMVALAAALILIVKAIGGLAEVYKQYDYDLVQSAIGAIVLVMLGIGATLWMSSKVQKGLPVVLSVVAIVGALYALAKVVEQLGKIGKTKMNKGLKAVAILTACLAILMLAIGKMQQLKNSGGKSDDGWGLAKLGVGFISLAAALFTIVSALIFVGNHSKEIKAGADALGSLWMPLTIIGLILGTLVGMDYFTEGMLSKSIMKIAISIGIISAALLILGAALYVVGKALPVFLEGIANAGKVIKERGDEIKNGLVALITILGSAIVTAIVSKKDNLTEGLKTFLTGGIKGATTWLLGHKLLLGTLATVAGLLLLGFIAEHMPGFTEKLVKLLAIGITELASFIANSSDLVKAVGFVVAAIGELFLKALDKIGGVGFDLIFGTLFEALAWLADTPELTEKYQAIADKIHAVTKQGSGLWEQSSKEMAQARADFEEEMRNGMNTDLEQIAAENSTSYVEEFSDDISDPAVRAKVRAAAVASASDGLKQGSQDAFSSLFDWISNSNVSEEVGSQLIEKFMSGMSAEGGFTGIGEDIPKNILEGMDSNKDGVIDEADGIGAESLEAVAKFVGDYYHVGENDMLGLLAGVRSKKKLVIDEYLSVAQASQGVVINESDQHSPSKAFAKISTNDMLGWAKGVLDNGYLVTGAYENQAKAVINSVRGSMYAITQAMSSDLDSTSPVITPVLDLSDVRGGLSNVNGLFDKTRLALSGASVELNDNLRFRAENSKREQNSIIGALRKDVNTLAGAIQDSNLTVEVPVNIDGRETARVIAPYARNELNRLDRNENRRNGRV